jgi:hypothetical protein
MIFKRIKETWENAWLPTTEVDEEEEISKKKAQLEIKRDRKYESRWVWYHTLLAVEILITNVLLLWIAIKIC